MGGIEDAKGTGIVSMRVGGVERCLLWFAGARRRRRAPRAAVRRSGFARSLRLLVFSVVRCALRIDGIGRVLCVPAKRCYPTSSSAPAAGNCGHRRPQNVIDDGPSRTRFVKSGINQTVHIRNLAASDRIQSSPEHHEKKARPARRFCSMRSVAQSDAIHRAL